jgi:hypothetical protein
MPQCCIHHFVLDEESLGTCSLCGCTVQFPKPVGNKPKPSNPRLLPGHTKTWPRRMSLDEDNYPEHYDRYFGEG